MTEPKRRAAAERAKPDVPPMRAATPETPAVPGGAVPGGGGVVRPDAVTGGAMEPRGGSGAVEPAGTEPGTADPGTADPGTADPGTADPGTAEPRAGHDEPVRAKRTRISGLWVGITVAAVVLLLLLIFIVQNNTYVTIYFFGWGGAFPLGVALLLAAICGVLLVAVPGYGRIIQLRRNIRRAARPR